MKKIVLALSIMAIAFTSFQEKAKADLVSQEEFKKAEGYVIRMRHLYNKNLITDYKNEQIISFLMEHSCKTRSLSFALELLKEKDYDSYAVTILAFNDKPSYRNMIRGFTEELCPNRAWQIKF